MAIYGYVRVSTAEQAKEDRSSLELQRRKIEGLALAGGWTLDEIFIEAGVSGSIALDKRPEGGRMWAMLRSGDTIIAAKLDRLFRSAADALHTADVLKAKGVHLILLDMGVEPVTTSGVAKLFFGILALMAEFERSRTKERIFDARAAKRALGGHVGGIAPFGWIVEGEKREARLVEHPDQQQAIKTMRELRSERKTLRAIKDAVQAQHGFTVSHVTIRAVLRRGEGMQ